MRLGRLSPEEIETWLNDELANGLAPSSVHRHYRTLRRVLQTAVEKDRLLTNPCDRVRPPKVPKTAMTVLTWEQAIGAGRSRTPSGTAADLRRHRHRHALERARRAAAGERRRRAPQDPGGRAARPARRRLPSPPPTEDRLRHTHRSRSRPRWRPCSADHLDRFVRAGPDALVFTNGAGQPLSHSSFQTHHFRRAQLAAGVSCRFHDLRHTSVALAIAEGAHPKAIQVRMGHSSITVTLDRYGHLFPELDEAIATAFDARFRALASARESKNSM